MCELAADGGQPEEQDVGSRGWRWRVDLAGLGLGCPPRRRAHEDTYDDQQPPGASNRPHRRGRGEVEDGEGIAEPDGQGHEVGTSPPTPGGPGFGAPEAQPENDEEEAPREMQSYSALA